MSERLSKANIETILDVAKERGVQRGVYRRGNDSFAFDFSPGIPAVSTDEWDKAIGQNPTR
jgi:hypothetical protein